VVLLLGEAQYEKLQLKRWTYFWGLDNLMKRVRVNIEKTLNERRIS
jgi:hypothetical protein